ncbi:MAG: YjgN family protein, partial [Sphingobium sp.]
MQDEQHSAFAFHGSWREYAPIAFTNLLLTIVTLGIYRFWATTRTRRYLWAQTRFIDDRLEWTGTGKELFVGFLLVLLLFGIPFIFLQFGAQALVFQGYPGVAAALGFVAFLAIFYLTGIARYRALRYRLSRTFWHGIRGGSDNQGWGFGLSYMWKTFVSYLTLGLLIPWSMMSLWNQRWRAMSFGPFAFAADGSARVTFKRFLLFYLAPILFLLMGIAVASVTGAAMGGVFVQSSLPPVLQIVVFFVIVLGVYVLLGMIALAYYSAFIREAISKLTLEDLSFTFEAGTDEWLKLIFGDIALVVGTLGIGAIFLSYRHWAFFIRHMEATGEIDLNRLTQSTT